MKRFILYIIAALCVFSTSIRTQTLYFPPVSGDMWDTISPGQLQWQTKYIDTLYSFLQDNNSKAFLLLKDGKIVLEKYFGSFTKDSVWYWASAGKTLTAFAIGLAQQEGKLSIYDTTSKYLGTGWTSLTPDKEQAITIRHQLTMTTGLNDGVADADCTLPDCLEYKADAGTRWAYHNAPYTLLDSVIEKATGQLLNAFIYQRLHAKTGFNGLYAKSGYNNVFFSTPRNMARFGILLLNKGTWDNKVILQDTAYFSQMTHSSQTINPSYGYLAWLNGQSSYMIPQTQFVFPGYLNPSAPADMFAAMGKNGQFINIVPSMNLIWVRVGDAPDNSLVPFVLNEQIWRKLNAIMNRTTDVKNPAPANNVQASAISLYALPNPFNPSCTIRYILNESSSPIDLSVYDINGSKCKTLYQGDKPAGEYQAVWNGTDENNRTLSSGMYIIRLQAGNRMQSTKVLFLK